MLKKLLFCIYNFYENKKIGEVVYIWIVFGFFKVLYFIKGYNIYDIIL